MKTKLLDRSDLEMWMYNNFTLYACDRVGPHAIIAAHRKGLAGGKRLTLKVNHQGVCRVTLEAEILLESTNIEEAIKIYNENL